MVMVVGSVPVVGAACVGSRNPFALGSSRAVAKISACSSTGRA